jgi:undecaprenyl-diphosphatase
MRQSIMGPVSLAVIVVAVLGLVVAGWVMRRGPRLAAAAHRAHGWPLVRRLAAPARERGYPAWLARRLAIDEAALLALAIGLAGTAALAVLFAVLLDGVLDGEGIALVDPPVSRWLADHRDGWLTAVLRVVTDLGSPVALGVLAACVAALVAWRRRSWLPAVLGVLGAAGIGLVIALVKGLVGRDRPPLPYAVIPVTGYSFPSGHAAGTSAVALLSAWLLTHWLLRSWAGQVAVWAVALALVGLVGFSRTYLGVHYLSDVLAGWALGAVWAATLVLAGSWWAQARRAAPAPVEQERPRSGA